MKPLILFILILSIIFAVISLTFLYVQFPRWVEGNVISVFSPPPNEQARQILFVKYDYNSPFISSTGHQKTFLYNFDDSRSYKEGDTIEFWLNNLNPNFTTIEKNMPDFMISWICFILFILLLITSLLLNYYVK